MKKILIFILIALVLYLIYLYWQKYRLTETFFNDENTSNNNILNNDDNILNDANIIKNENMSVKRDIKNNYQNNKKFVCANGVCKLGSHRPLNKDNNKDNNKDKLNGKLSMIDNNYNEEIDDNYNEEIPNINSENLNIDDINSEDNCLLTEGVLGLVDEYVQSKKRQHVFMDIKINEEDAGRVVFELFDDIVPYTVDNFIFMCENHYKGSVFHRIIKDFIIQGGDYINSDGTGSNSIYGKKFKDENFNLKHDSKYLLSMANSGPNTNGCQFFITLNKLANLDNKHVVFGRVADDESKLIVDRLGEVFTNSNDYPIVKCEIANSGLLSEIN